MRMLSAVSWYVCNQVHRAFEAGRAACDVDAGELRHHFLKGGGGFEDLGRQMQQTPNGVQIGGAVTVRQKAIMADSDKARWQGVQQKPAYKLNGADGGRF